MQREPRFRGRFVISLTILAASLLLPHFSTASDLVFGPVTCLRGTGAPTVFNYVFSVPEPSRGFILKVFNGGLEDTTYELVSSSVIMLNGVQILGPSNFNQDVTSLEVPANLQAQNTLTVEVRGKPGGALVIKLYPFVVIDTPTSGQMFSTTSVSVTGHLYSDETGISVNGVSGTVTGTTFAVNGVPLVEGSNVLTATAVRAGGFTGQASVSVTRDTTPPAITLTSPHDGATVSTPAIDIVGSVDDPAAVVTVNGSAAALVGTSFTAHGISLQVGLNSIPIEARDALGNRSILTLNVTYTPPAPTATLAAVPPQIQVGNNSTLQWTTSGATAVSISPGVGSVTTGGTQTVSPTATTTYTLTATGPGGTVNADITVTVLYPPSVTLSASPGAILDGSSTTLAWEALNASTCSIAPDVGAVAVSGTSSVSPTTTTTYTISCSGSGGTATASTTVTVNYQPPTASISAAPASVLQGTSSTLSWNANYAQTCDIDNGIGSVQCRGSVSVTPNTTTTYTLTATGRGGIATEQTVVNVTYPIPTVTLDASPGSVLFGGASALSWSSTNATAVSIEPAVGEIALSGSMSVSPSASTTYTITATGLGGSATATATITVAYPPPTASLTATPTSVLQGTASTLTWTTTDSQTCSIDNGIGTVPCSGSQVVTPPATMTYVLTAVGPGGTVTAQSVVTVVTSAPVAKLSATPNFIPAGYRVMLSWTSTNAFTCSLNNGIGTVACNGSKTVAPTVTTTYVLSATGPGGAVTDQTILTVAGGSEPPVSIVLNAFPQSIPQGAWTNLSWSVSSGGNCSIDNGIGPVSCSGGRLVSPTATTTYTLTVIGPWGPTVPMTVKTTVTVTAPLPVISITASPQEIPPGGSTTLSWSSTNADACSISGIGAVALSGAMTMSPIATTTYSITASGPTGSTTSYVVVTVKYPAPTVTISVSPREVLLGGSSNLSWSSTNATSCSIDQGIGTVATSGSIVVTPSAATTYTITATGLGGTTTAFVNVVVTYPAPTVTMSISPSIILLGESATLSWSSTNASYCVINWGVGVVATSGTLILNPSLGTYTYSVTAYGPGGALVTAQAQLSVNMPAPTATLVASPDKVLLGASTTLSWSSTNAYQCFIQELGYVGCNSDGTRTVTPAETTIYTLYAYGYGGTTVVSTTVVVDYPEVEVSIQASPSTIHLGETATLSWNTVGGTACVVDQEIGLVSPTGSRVVQPNSTTEYAATVVGPKGVGRATVVVTVLGNVQPQPEGSFGASYQDLIPADATLSTYNPRTFSLVTGTVTGRDGQAIDGVRVSVHGHPEYGTVTTDDKGQFALPVEGGNITVGFRKDGLLPSQRKVDVLWNKVTAIDTVTLIPEDVAVTRVIFDGDPQKVFVHQSSWVSDMSGSRSAKMIFTGDNAAYAEVDNNAIPLHTISVRATEYESVNSMPSMLPPTSGFTYCVNMSVDGADRIRFAKPITAYVDNFLGFPVGMPVPLGYYDFEQAAWIPEENGVVVRLLDLDGDGIIDGIDSTGDGEADDLNGDGGTADETIGLNSGQFIAGETYWRTTISHFTPHDLNWALSMVGAKAPVGLAKPIVDQPKTKDDKSPTRCTNSYVDELGRVYHEDIAIPGTDIRLQYSSDTSGRVVTIPIASAQIPASVKRIEVRLIVAGKEYGVSADPTSQEPVRLSWDGRDILERQVTSAISGEVRVGYVYDVNYAWPAGSSASFGLTGIAPTTVPGRLEVTLWQSSEVNMLPVAEDTIAQGWSLSDHRQLDRGDGVVMTERTGISKRYGKTIATVAGNGSEDMFLYAQPDGISALDAGIVPFGIEVDRAGNVYFTNNYFWTQGLYKIDATGKLHRIIDRPCGYNVYFHDSCLIQPGGIAVDHLGNVYVASTNSFRVQKVDPNGIISSIAGNSQYSFSDEEGIATALSIGSPLGVAVDDDGNVYFTAYRWDYISEGRIYKVDKRGVLTRLAPGTHFVYPEGIDVDHRGNIYVADGGANMVYRLDLTGQISKVAGIGPEEVDAGDGALATEARLDWPSSVKVDSIGNLYIADSGHYRVRKVDTTGVISTVAGNGQPGYEGDGGMATDARMKTPISLALDGSDDLYIVDSGFSTIPLQYNNRIRKVTSPGSLKSVVGLTDEVIADDKGLGYAFNPAGVHVATLDLHSGVPLMRYGYDSDKRLVSVTDQFGNRTEIDRDGTGRATGIRSPNGEYTVLNVDSAGDLRGVVYPDGSGYFFDYNMIGLMIEEIDPNGNHFTHSFDAAGKLEWVSDPEGGGLQLSQNVNIAGEVMTYLTTAEGLTTINQEGKGPLEEAMLTSTYPDGSVRTSVTSADRMATTLSLSCGTTEALEYDWDKVFQYRTLRSEMVRVPSGLTSTTRYDRNYQFAQQGGLPERVEDSITRNGRVWTSMRSVGTGSYDLVSPVGRLSTVQYDINTLQPLSISVPGILPTSYEYDSRGRLIATTVGERKAQYFYDPYGHLDYIQDSEGKIHDYTYNLMGRLQSELRPDGSVVDYQYDANGNLTVLANPNDVPYSFDYTANNQRKNFVQPLSGTYSYLYDKDRRMKTVILPSGETITNNYAQGNLSTTTTPEGVATYDYLCGSRLGSATLNGESVSFGYDGPLVTNDTRAGTMSGAVSYTYNNDYAVTSMSYAGATTSLAYDDDGLLTSAGGYAISRNLQNGLPESVSGSGLVQSRTFNGYGELDGSVSSVGGLSPYSWSVPARDNADRILRREENIGGTAVVWEYFYNSLGRVTDVKKDGVVVESYTYDFNGNRLSEANSLRGIPLHNYELSIEDHVLNAGSDVYQFDVNGYLMSKAATDGTTQYVYSSRGELQRVDKPDGTILSYIHDPMGRRIAKQVNGTTVEKYLWAGQTTLLAMYDGSDNLVQRYAYADARMPVSMTAGGTTYFLLTDQVGSLRAIADSTGTIVKRVDYDSFGNIIADSNPGFSVPFGFAGGLHDRDTGLVRFGYRDYSPELGRFVAKDPIDFAGGDTNLYAYVMNDPINLIDPLGLWVNPITYWKDFSGGAGDLWKRYWDMRDANTIGSDRYFHCVAHCEASSRGMGGNDVSALIGEGRELFDEFIKRDSPSACNADRAANDKGRNGDLRIPCSRVCGSLRPNGLSPKY